MTDGEFSLSGYNVGQAISLEKFGDYWVHEWKTHKKFKNDFLIRSGRSSYNEKLKNNENLYSSLKLKQQRVENVGYQ
jgi:hypothetical protein